jgi:hypothetical protein
MDSRVAVGKLGFCGLNCAICSHREGGCVGCREGGGDEFCQQRKCAQERSIKGCWDCDGFPCSRGYFRDPAWMGLTLGACTVAHCFGPAFLARAMENCWGPRVDYGEHRHRSTCQVVQELAESPGDDSPQGPPSAS